MGIDERSPFSAYYECLVGECNSTGVCGGLPKRIDRPVYSHSDMRDDARKKVLFRDSLHMILGRTILAMFTQIILTHMFYAEYFENLRS